MRSLHIIGSRRSGGAERFFLRLVPALARRGEDVLTLMQPGSELSASLDSSVPQRTLRMRSVFDVFARARITAMVKTSKADVVQTYMGRAARLTRLGARGKSRGKTPLHVAWVGGYYDVKGYRHADAWVANAQGIRDYLVEQGLPSERVFCVGHFVGPPASVDEHSLNALRSELDLDERSWAVVCLGRLHRNKAFDVLLDAFARLPPQINGRTPRLIVVGDGPEAAALKAQARTLALESRVRFVGWQTSPEPYLKLADLFVCSSRHEPIGNVVLEAWNERVPVVATRTGGTAELVTDGEDARLVPPEDADALAGAMLALLDADDEVRAGLVRGASRTLAAKHSEQVIVDAYLALYATLIGD